MDGQQLVLPAKAGSHYLDNYMKILIICPAADDEPPFSPKGQNKAILSWYATVKDGKNKGEWG